MKNLLLSLACISILAPKLIAADEKPATLTFYITGMECPGCAYNVTNSLNDVKGFVEARIDSLLDGYANITFDDRKATVHQIAHAVAEAYPLHGKPYDAALKIRVPGYAKGDNEAKVKGALGKLKDSISLIVEDKSKGLLLVRFQPLAVKENVAGPLGIDVARILDVIRNPAPKGLGLACELVSEGLTPPK